MISLSHCFIVLMHMPDMKEGDCGHDQENYTQYDTGVCQDKTFFMGNDFAGDSVCCVVYRGVDTAASGICTGSACIVGRCLCDCKFCYDQYTEALKNQIKIHTMKEKKRIRHRNGSEPRQDIWPRFNRKMSKRY